jgi:hypothetical protein
MGEKAMGERCEGGIVPDPQRVGYQNPPFRSQSLDGDPGIAGLQRLNPPLQRRVDIVIGQDVQLRPKPFCGTLPHRESAAGPAVEGVMRIVPLRGLQVPGTPLDFRQMMPIARSVPTRCDPDWEEFAPDSPLEGRVRSEPVSEIRSIPGDSGRNSWVLAQKITKNRNPGS